MDQIEFRPVQNTQIKRIPLEPDNLGNNKPRKKKYIGIAIIIFLIFFIGIVSYLNSKSGNSLISQGSDKELELSVPIESEIASAPFAEMTVPYLREKKYESKLSTLSELSDNGTYTSYLTSYESDGLKVNGLLTRPNAEEPEGGFPAIVFIHGYIPPTQYITTEKYADYVDYLARNGFVVFKIDLRGHGESEGEPGGGYYGSDYVIDALNARSALQVTDFVNPEKIGMWGHSMAGNVIMRAFAAKPEIKAVNIWAGAVYTYLDQRKYGINDNSYRPPGMSSQRINRRQQLFEKVGSPSASSTFWQQVAPTNYLNDLKGAIEIHHAVNDDVVDVMYSRDLDVLLDETTVPHELYEYESGGHNIDGVSFGVAMERTTAFFKKYLE